MRRSVLWLATISRDPFAWFLLFGLRFSQKEGINETEDGGARSVL